MIFHYPHRPRFDAEQGASEARIETHAWYVEGALELATKFRAKNISRVASPASKQADVARGCGEE